MVAPFLPRSGTAYIPRPPLAVAISNETALDATVTISGVTSGRGSGTMTLRVRSADGERVFADLAEPIGNLNTLIVFDSVPFPETGEYRIEALTSFGQRGVVLETVTLAAPLQQGAATPPPVVHDNLFGGAPAP